MRDYQKELENRVAFIKGLLEKSGAKGIIFGNSGGKDCALVGILCKKACNNTVGVIMPCMSKRNYTIDKEDALEVASQFDIETREVDLSPVKEQILNVLDGKTNLNDMANANISPRLRMITLYSIAASEGRLVAGTGNRSERHMGYFTKWGDGACDFNPIADLTVTEVYEFLNFLNAPQSVIKKAPSAALFDDQTDEKEMGVTYAAIDNFLLNGVVNDKDKAIIDRYHNGSEHKRKMPEIYTDNN